MSRASISTGGILFTGKRSEAAPKPLPVDPDQPLHIAIIADFSGRGSRGEVDLEGLAKRRMVEIDRDNFDEVFARLDVRLKLPFQEQPLSFSEIDELHPDVLLNELDLFSEFRKLQHKLRKQEHFEEAAAEIRSWATVDTAPADDAPQETPAAAAETGTALPEDLFAAVLSESREQADSAMREAGNVGRLIQTIVGPYIEPRENPDRAKYQAAVDDAMAQSLRRLMHCGDFLRLEGNWRALQMLVGRLETDSSLKLFILDASREELLDDAINAESVADSALYRRLVIAQQEPGSTPFSLLNIDVEIDDDIDSLRLAAALGQVAEGCGSLAICSASGHLAGCDDLHGQVDKSDWDYRVDGETLAAWQTFRTDSAAAHLIACAPRFLVRLPYGTHTDPIERFDFEELGDERRHEFYCWAPGSYLVTLTIGEGFTRHGWDGALVAVDEVEDLPVHIYTDDDGDSAAQACAEVYLRDPAAQALSAVGICSLRSIRGRDAVSIPRKYSVHVSGAVQFAGR